MPDFLQGLWSTALSMCIINEQGVVEDANLALCTTLGYPSQQLIGTDMMLLLAHGDASKTRALRQQFRDKRCAIAQGVWQLRAASGHYLPLQVLGSWITKREGRLFKLVVLIHEVCTEEGSALLEHHVLNTKPRDRTFHLDQTVIKQTTTASSKTASSKTAPSQIAASKTTASTSAPAKTPESQRLQQRIIMLEGQLSAYKAALDRYKMPTGIHFEEGAWYVQLPDTRESNPRISEDT